MDILGYAEKEISREGLAYAQIATNGLSDVADFQISQSMSRVAAYSYTVKRIIT